jgi:N-acetylneuraminic acid mutarotase
VASGGLVLSATENNAALLNAGYVKIGATTMSDAWLQRVNVPPAARQNFMAVWTGSEMIVWGGIANNGTFLNDGGRYNPAGNSWTAVSSFNALAARYNHTAVWTGREMIVWGGRDFTKFYNDGGRYDPAGNSWAAMSTNDAPARRDNHNAVWTGSEMIVWAGYGDNYLNSGGRYHPASNSWTAVSTNGAPAARAYHTAVWTGSEMIVWGGYGFTASLNDGGHYNPIDNSWTAMSPNGAPAARYQHTAVWTGSEMIVWGGDNSLGNLFNDGGRYNLAGDSWTLINALPNTLARRSLHTAVWTGSEMIVWGGISFDGGFRYLNDGGRYHPASNSWTTTSANGAPAGRVGDMDGQRDDRLGRNRRQRHEHRRPL